MERSYLADSSFVIQPFNRKHLVEYYKRMSKDNLSELWDDNVASVLQEQGFSITSNPRSVYKVEKLYEALGKFEPSKAPKVDSSIALDEGVKLAYACFAKPKTWPFLSLSAFSPEFVLNITSNRNASAGLTAWGEKKATAYVRAYERALQQLHGEKSPDPCAAFKRTQFDDKTRLVWGYPYAMTALEGIFARPLINQFKKGNTPMAFGKSTGLLGAELRVSSYHKKWAYSLDVKSYDSSIPSKLIYKAFDILSTWFDLNEIEPTSQVPYSKIWKDVVRYFIHTPIVMPDGRVYKGKKHGVPSGSYFTQLVDSVVNVIFCGAIAYEFKLNVAKEDIYVLGDDLLFWSNRRVSLEDMASYGSRVLGVQFNSKKSNVYTYLQKLHYLGRDWDDGIPTLSVDEITMRMAQPETYRKYSKDAMERDIQVRMLLLSYAAVYREAYPIYLKCLDIRPRYDKSNMSIENYVYGGNTKAITKQVKYHLSGYLRYKRMMDSDIKRNGGNVPLALQFWK